MGAPACALAYRPRRNQSTANLLSLRLVKHRAQRLRKETPNPREINEERLLALISVMTRAHRHRYRLVHVPAKTAACHAPIAREQVLRR